LYGTVATPSTGAPPAKAYSTTGGSAAVDVMAHSAEVGAISPPLSSCPPLLGNGFAKPNYEVGVAWQTVRGTSGNDKVLTIISPWSVGRTEQILDINLIEAATRRQMNLLTNEYTISFEPPDQISSNGSLGIAVRWSKE
jgi:hypothetical protein